MTATLEMNFENNLAGIRTPLKTPTSSRLNLKQLHKTPGLHMTPGFSKTPGLGGIGGTPGKGGICATPRRGLTNITNRSLAFVTPGFKKPTSRLSPNLRIPLKTKTPAQKQSVSKFSVHFDDDVVLKEMKEKHFTIEEREICPWDRAKTEGVTPHKKKVTLELDNVLHMDSPKLPSFSPLKLNLDSLNSTPTLDLDSTLDLGELNLSCLSVNTPVRCSPVTSDPVLEQMEREGFTIESIERCPWSNTPADDVERKPLPRLELELSVIDDSRLSLDTSSFILQEDLSPLVLDLLADISELDLSDMPDMPSSPDLERSIMALLDL